MKDELEMPHRGVMIRSALKKPIHSTIPPRDKKGVRARPAGCGYHSVQVKNAFAITLLENEKAFAELIIR